MLGDIVADDLPSMQSTRKELRRLSMKYDGVTE